MFIFPLPTPCLTVGGARRGCVSVPKDASENVHLSPSNTLFNRWGPTQRSLLRPNFRDLFFLHLPNPRKSALIFTPQGVPFYAPDPTRDPNPVPTPTDSADLGSPNRPASEADPNRLKPIAKDSVGTGRVGRVDQSHPCRPAGRTGSGRRWRSGLGGYLCA